MPGFSSSGTREAAISSARAALAENPVFLDTETTGLDAGAEILEIAVVDSSDKVLLNTLVKPLRPIPMDATRIHGISDEMVASAPRWIALWGDLRSHFFDRSIAIYNAEFDLRMIDQTNKACGIARWAPGKPVIDIMKIYADFRQVWDSYRNSNRIYKLQDAGDYLQIPLPNSHHALDDTLLAKAVLQKVATFEA